LRCRATGQGHNLRGPLGSSPVEKMVESGQTGLPGILLPRLRVPVVALRVLASGQTSPHRALKDLTLSYLSSKKGGWAFLGAIRDFPVTSTFVPDHWIGLHE